MMIPHYKKAGKFLQARQKDEIGIEIGDSYRIIVSEIGDSYRIIV